MIRTSVLAAHIVQAHQRKHGANSLPQRLGVDMGLDPPNVLIGMAMDMSRSNIRKHGLQLTRDERTAPVGSDVKEHRRRVFMRRYRKWVLTLGIMAVSPGIATAGPLSFMNFKKDKPAATSQAQVANQKMAEDIAAALRAARLSGYEIEIEFKSGTATLTGMIANSQQKQRASRVVSRVPSVQRVDNRLRLIRSAARPAPKAAAGTADPFNSGVRQVNYEPQANAGGVRQAGGIQQANFDGDIPLPPPAAQQVAPQAVAPAMSNQQMAQQIANALSNARLQGYDVEIRYSNGTATLNGAVGHPQQRIIASQVVSGIPGVNAVNNQLRVAAPGPVQAAAYNQGPAPGAPPQYGHAAPGTTQAAFSSSPKLPQNAWPTYAAYPNSAAVSYPKQYSASAWPYIGPFYPYPQVPQGWREVSLKWDDGNWALDFDSKTDRWFWFMNPKNW